MEMLNRELRWISSYDNTCDLINISITRMASACSFNIGVYVLNKEIFIHKSFHTLKHLFLHVFGWKDLHSAIQLIYSYL